MTVRIRALLGWCRRKGEALVFSGILLFLLPVAVAVYARGLIRGQDRAYLRAQRRLALGRWGRFLCVGLRDLREFWWVQFSLESALDIWRQLILLEWVSLRNAVKKNALPEWSGRLGESARILVVKLSHYGDAMHVVPMLRALREQRPKSRIELLAGPWCEDLARRIAYIDEYIAYTPNYVVFNRGDRTGCRGIRSELRFLKELKDRRYDVVISTSTTNLPEWLILHAADPAVWVGVPGPDTAYTSRSVALVEGYDSQQYEAGRGAGLLRHLGLAPGSSMLEFPLREKESAWVKTRLSEHGLDGDRFVAVIAPGSGWPGKNWPVERFAGVADWLVDCYNAGIVLLGSAAEQPLGAVMRRTARVPLVDLIGQTGWGQAAGVLACSGLLITNDNALLHIAAALNIPTVSLFGPTIPGKWAPTGARHRYLRHPTPCVAGCWCWHTRAACHSANACMRAITQEEVKEAIASVLSPIMTQGHTIGDSVIQCRKKALAQGERQT